MYMYIYTVKKQVFGPHSKLPVKKESERSPTGKTFSHSINLENLISCTQFEWRRAINIKRQKAVRIWPNLRREEKASRGHDDGIENREFSINSIEFSGAIFFFFFGFIRTESCSRTASLIELRRGVINPFA